MQMKLDLHSRQTRYRSALALMLGLNMMLITGRFVITCTGLYSFLVWNLFLAGLPVVFITFARKLLLYDKAVHAFVFTGLSILFLPNAPYILTDLFHLRTTSGNMLAYDTLLIASCAATGLFFFYVTVRKLEVILLYLLDRKWKLPIITCVSLLCGFGVYLGRYERLNSWEVITAPDNIIRTVSGPLLDPFQHLHAWGLTLVYGTAMLVLYLVSNLLTAPNEQSMRRI